MKCEKCGRKQFLYKEKHWCRVCDKPEIKETKKYSLNLVQALEHLEAIGERGIKQRLIEFLANNFKLINNSFLDLQLTTYYNYLKDCNDPIAKDFLILRDVFNIEDEITFEVSW